MTWFISKPISAVSYEQDDFAVTQWTYYETVPTHDIAPDQYASALERLHAGTRQVDLTGDWLPHFMDRVDEAQRLVDDPTTNPEVAGADRELLGTTLRPMRRAIVARGASEQLLHAEPNPGTRSGRGAGCFSSTSRRAVEGRSSSTSLMRPFPRAGRRSRSTRSMPVQINRSSASAGSSCWRWSPRGAASRVTISRTAALWRWTGSVSCAQPSGGERCSLEAARGAEPSCRSAATT